MARYPGTCRNLTEAERIDRGRSAAASTPAAGRRRHADCHDMLHGDITAEVDDVVLRRNDGVPAYNLAVVVDDAFSGVDQVVRGDDLLPAQSPRPSSPNCSATGRPSYAHVPLAVNAAGHGSPSETAPSPSPSWLRGAWSTTRYLASSRSR